MQYPVQLVNENVLSDTWSINDRSAGLRLPSKLKSERSKKVPLKRIGQPYRHVHRVHAADAVLVERRDLGGRDSDALHQDPSAVERMPGGRSGRVVGAADDRERDAAGAVGDAVDPVVTAIDRFGPGLDRADSNVRRALREVDLDADVPDRQAGGATDHDLESAERIGNAEQRADQVDAGRQIALRRIGNIGCGEAGGQEQDRGQGKRPP